MALEAVGDVALGVHQQIAWQTDDSFIRAAAGGWWQFGGGSIRDVNSDDGKVAVVEFPDVRATATTDGLCFIIMRVGTDAFDESHANNA